MARTFKRLFRPVRGKRFEKVPGRLVYILTASFSLKYVEVPGALLARTRELKKYFDSSLAYVSSLKPKATAKKAKRPELAT